MGVAASRDEGISICKTEYFLLLDGHMRFYDDLWVGRIIEELEKDEKALLCCQTEALIIDSQNENILVHKERPPSYGACVDLYGEIHVLESRWVFCENDKDMSKNTVQVPCVLGAAYACSKKYWEALHGLKSLKSYGSDEAYISIKVWLNGGECKLLKDVKVGHIYRTNPPYKTEYPHIIYNRLLMVELFIPHEQRVKFRSKIKHTYNKIYSEAYLLLYQYKDDITQLKKDYKDILIKDFSFFEAINNQANVFKEPIEETDTLLDNIASYLIIKNQSINDIGILNGRMGIAIFLYHYARFSNNDVFCQLAGVLLDDICNSLKDPNIPINFRTGIYGIGWGIEYLYQNKFIDGEINDVLEEFDNKVMEINPDKILDLSLNTGLGGITHYVLSRMYTIEKEKTDNPFDDKFITALYSRLKSIIELKNTDHDSMDVFINFVKYYKHEKLIKPSSLYDIACLIYPPQYNMGKHPLGIYGSAGTGLKLILEEEQIKRFKYDKIPNIN